MRLKNFVSYHRNCLLALTVLGIVCSLFMWPRLRSAQFGMLDDGVTLTMAKHLSRDPQDAFTFMQGSGRFIPAYWLFNTLIYRFAGLSSRLWFMGNFLFLLSITWGIYLLVRLRSGTVLQSMLAGLFFCFSASTVESFYTLSKTEPLMTLWLLSGVILVLLSRELHNKFGQIGLTFAAMLFFLMAFATKEPAIVAVAISAGWLITARLLNKHAKDRFDIRTARNLFLLLSISAIVNVALRMIFDTSEITQGAYSSKYSFNWPDVINQLWRWLGWFVRNYLFIVPLLLGLLDRKVRNHVNKRLLLDSLIWTIGWVAIFLPWNVLEAYHTLPFTVGSSIIAGICAGTAVQVLFGTESNLKSRGFASLCLLGSLLLWQFTLVNNFYLARTQLVYDFVNSRMVNFLSKTEQGSVLYFNIPPTEYVPETAWHLEVLKNRSDVTIEGFQYQRPEGSQPLGYYVITPITDNVLLPNVRNSLHDPGAKSWNACFQAFINGHLSPEYAIIRRLRWIDFGFNRLLDDIGLKDLLSYHLNTLPFFETREMKYGWQVYKLTVDPKKIAYPGMFLDRGVWILKDPNGEKVITGFGKTGSSPLTGDLDGDRWTDLGVYEPDTHRFRFDTNRDGQSEFDFQLSKMYDGDVPVFGDWDGNGSDTPGFFRPSDSSWHIRNSFLASEDETVVRLEAKPGGLPLAGDWNGDGADSFGIYYPDSGEVWITNSIASGSVLAWAYTSEQFALPVVANWYAFGLDTIALVKNGLWWIRPNNISCVFPNPIPPVEFGDASGVPIAGRWK